MSIRFSGTAAQVQSAFHTEIHNLIVKGVAHIGNMSDPQIPAALSPVVVGVKALHNFFPRPPTSRQQVSGNRIGTVAAPRNLRVRPCVSATSRRRTRPPPPSRAIPARNSASAATSIGYYPLPG